MYLEPKLQMRLAEMANSLGHPFYFYELDSFEKHLKEMLQASNGIAKLWYACKANPLSHILQILNDNKVNFDIASPGEFEQVRSQGVEAKKILCTGPAKSKELLKRYLNQGLETFVCESHNQVKWLNEVANGLDNKPKVLLRLQIHWDQEGTSVLGGSDITPFGLEHDEWCKLNLSDYQNCQFIGIHTFQWGNILEVSRLKEIWDTAIQKCQELASAMKMDCNVIDLGGGVGIPYRQEHKNVSWPDLMKELKILKEAYGIPEIWLELGRFAIGEFGNYITRIIDKKQVRKKEILVLDSGINQLARPTLTKESFPCEALIQSQQAKRSFQIHGPLCTALDQLGTYSLPSDVKIGDWLSFSQAGAYGFTESMPYFLCHSLPAEIIKYQQQIEMVRAPKPANTYLV